MKKHIGLPAVILGILCLCGCDKFFSDMKLTEPAEEWIALTYDVPVKQGYYLSNNDDSYIVIENNRLTVVGVDWESHYREIYPRQENQTESEYEEEVSQEIQFIYTNLYVNQPYISVRYVNRSERFPNPYLILVTNTTEETLSKTTLGSGFGYSVGVFEMPDENTIRCGVIDGPYNYVYCGTSLPESVQTQTSD